MTHIQHTSPSSGPIDDVWDYVMDTRNDPKWMANVIEVGRSADQPLAVGLEIEETVKFYGVRFRPRSRHRARAAAPLGDRAGTRPGGRRRHGQLRARAGRRRDALHDGAPTTDAHGFFKLAEPVFARMARRDLATQLPGT